MINLVVDIGNSTCKVAVFNKTKLVKKQTFESVNGFITYYYMFKSYEINKKILASVVELAKDEQQFFKENNFLFFSIDKVNEIEIEYNTPLTLGQDRICSVLGAKAVFPNKNCLIIDIGTCVTFDYISEKREYLGGSISPGFNMRFKALNNFTSKLPLLSGVKKTELIGKSTIESIQSGVINGLLAEINGIIEQYKRINPNFVTVLCGGDADFVGNHLSITNYHIEKDLVLIGLNTLLLGDA